MKRSEMIEHLKAEIEEHLLTLKYRPNTEKYFSDTLANEILDIIEGFDMKPPYRPATTEDLEDWGVTQDFIDEHNFTVQEWEPEND